MSSASSRVQLAVWVFIYGGIFAAIVGYAVQNNGDAWGWGLAAAGAVAVLIGAVLIVVRSRMADAPASPGLPISSLEEP